MIDFEDVHYRTILNGIDLHLEAGKVYGLLGRNGMGKSTLLYMLSGLLFPRKGQVLMEGKNPGKRDRHFLDQYFLVPEDIELPNCTIGNFLRWNSSFYSGFDAAAFDRYLDGFELSRAQKIQQLSHGQRKKAYIAFALACNTKILAMDEPTNGIDIPGKQQFYRMLANAMTDEKCLLISTHLVKDLENILDGIIVMENGKIIFNRTIAEIGEKLSFTFSHDKEDLGTAIYSEESLKGYAMVKANMDTKESHPDLELLYKALLQQPETINNLFNK